MLKKYQDDPYRLFCANFSAGGEGENDQSDINCLPRLFSNRLELVQTAPVQRVGAFLW